MNRHQALAYVGHSVDDALAVHTGEVIPLKARLVGWDCGFEPMFVAVHSYLPAVRLDDDTAEEIATDYLKEIGWFSGELLDEPPPATYVI
jgi:hypothetical protein